MVLVMNEFEIDKKQVRRAFSRAASGYDAAAVLQREVCSRMLEKLDYIKLKPARLLDAGSGTGWGTRQLGERYPTAEIIALDIAIGMLQVARGTSGWWKKLFAATRYLPLQQLVVLAGWVKARDSTGKVFWIEKRNLSSKRYVVVTARATIARQSWSSSATIAFRAERQVGLEWLGNVGSWVKVRHRDGSTGFIKNTDVWGE